MKNCNFRPGLYGALRHGRYLLLAFLFTLGSCQKDFISDVAVSENDAAGSIRYQSTSRSSDLESEVVEYTQWMISKVIPLVNDSLVYEDIKAGNYSNSRVTAKLSMLGFSSYTQFASEYVTKSQFCVNAIRSGLLSEENIYTILSTHFSDLDFSAVARIGGGASIGRPCYDQLIHNLTYVLIGGALGTIQGGPLGLLAGFFAAAAAFEAFYDCLDENYPRG